MSEDSTNAQNSESPEVRNQYWQEQKKNFRVTKLLPKILALDWMSTTEKIQQEDLKERMEIDREVKRSAACSIGKSKGDDMTETEEGISLGDVTNHHTHNYPAPANTTANASASSGNGFVKSLIPFVLGAAISGPASGMLGYMLNNKTVNPNTTLENKIVRQPPAFTLEGGQLVKTPTVEGPQ